MAAQGILLNTIDRSGEENVFTTHASVGPEVTADRFLMRRILVRRLIVGCSW